MTVRTIVKWPDSKLTQVAENVDPVSQETRELVQDLFDTMSAAFGAGLASTQVGVSKSVCIIRGDFIKDGSLVPDSVFKNAVVLINPEIKFLEDKKFRWKEACLSVDEVEEKVTRHRKVQLVYEDLSGVKNTKVLENEAAAVVQHEVDHLSGIVFLDRLPVKKRKEIKSKILQKKRRLREKKRKELEKIKKYTELEKKQNAEQPVPGFRVFSKNSVIKSRKGKKRKSFGKNKRRKK